MFSRGKISIKFVYSDAFDPPKPRPAVKFLPDWLKSLEAIDDENRGGFFVRRTAKKCVPVLDSFSHSFIIPFPCDVLVYNTQLYDVALKDGSIKTKLVKEEVDDIINESAIDFDVMEREVGIKIKTPRGFMNNMFATKSHRFFQFRNYSFIQNEEVPVLLNPFIIKTNKGVSCRFMTPCNYGEELPFKLFDGVVDTDNYQEKVNLPFEWKLPPSDQPYLIKCGSPMVQVLPFERKEMDVKFEEISVNKFFSEHNLLKRFVDNYKLDYWHKRKSEND